MLTREHLETAVERRIITAEQAAGLARLAGEQVPTAAPHAANRAATDAPVVAEERFRIANGFNEIFVALGVALLSIGLLVSLGLNTNTRNPAATALALINAGAWSALYIGLLWGLSEFLTGHLKMLAPSIILIIAMSTFAGILSVPLIDHFTRGGVDIVRSFNAPQGAALPWQLLIVPACVLAIAGAHHLRFNFPFSLLIVAGTVMSMIVIVIGMIQPRTLIDNWRTIMLVLGLSVFLVAMLYDLSDPTRVTNRNDCAFWLHMVAAPMIVHPLMPSGFSNALGVVGLFAVLAVVAVLVDRRAILVASLTYLVAAITTIMSQQGISPGQVAFMSLLVVGGAIVALGTGWTHLRRAMWSVIPALGPLERLRPR